MATPQFVPSNQEIDFMRALIVKHVTIGSGKTVIEFLIEDFRKSSGTKTHVSSDEILKKLPGDYSKGALGSLMKNLRRKVPALFEDGPAHDYHLKAWIDNSPGNYAIHFGVNDHEAPAIQLEGEFWKPYWANDRQHKPVRVYYPEPRFFRDKKDTYIRNPEVTTKEQVSFFSYLHAEGELRESFSYVPAGVVRAILSLYDFFQPKGVSLAVSAVRPGTMPDDEDEHVIILGTPTSNGMIPLKEGAMPLKVTWEAVDVDRRLKRLYKISSPPGIPVRHRYVDERNEGLFEKKWGLVTRCEHIAGRAMTIVSAKHGRTVQALIRSLTRHQELEGLQQLVRELDVDDTFPDRFQALFQVDMNKEAGENRVGPTYARLVVNLDPGARISQDRKERS